MRLEEIYHEIQTIEQQAKDGELNELKAYAWLNEIEKVSGIAKKRIQEAALMEADNYSEKSFDFENWVITKGSRTTWDYKHLSQWQEKTKEIKDFEELAKRANLQNTTFFDSDGIEILPAFCKKSDFLQIKAK